MYGQHDPARSSSTSIQKWNKVFLTEKAERDSETFANGELRIIEDGIWGVMWQIG
jgi:hypothetical protein